MPGKTLDFTVAPDSAGTRLDRCLSRLVPGSSRSFLQKLIKEGLVSGNGESITLPRYPVRAGMRIVVTLPEEPDTAPVPEPFEFPVLFEDEAMLVIAKPAGVVVHPAAGNPDGTVVNALIGRYPGMAETFSCLQLRPGIVHRLDKDTSGCLVVAKTPEAQFKLGTAFAEHRVKKTYLALVRGIPERRTGEIANLVGRHPVNRQKMAVVERNGKLAVTRYRTTRTGTIDAVAVSLLEVNIDTGRTHQIRVHMAFIGHPVIGDTVYGGARTGLSGADRQMLHAWKIALPHPLTGDTMEFTAPVPPDFTALLDRLKTE